MRDIEDIECELWNFTQQAITEQTTVNRFERGIDIIINQPSVTDLKRQVGLTNEAKTEEHEIDIYVKFCRLCFVQARSKWISAL